MSRLDELIAEHCPNGGEFCEAKSRKATEGCDEYKPLGEVYGK